MVTDTWFMFVRRPQNPLLVSAVTLLGLAAVMSSCQLDRVACPFGLPSKAVRQCRKILVPQDYASPVGATLSLAYAVLPGRSKVRSTVATVVIPGGPGGHIGSLPSRLPALLQAQGLTLQDDLIFYDQRGLGESRTVKTPPCSLRPLTAELAPDIFEKQVKDCLNGMKGELDPRFLNTAANADDIVTLARALGYQQVNLYGLSYGTRTAQEVVKRHPDFVRSLVLDGVVDPTVSPFTTQAVHFQQALSRFGADCHASGQCADGDLPGQIQRVGDQLERMSLNFPGQPLGLDRTLPIGGSVLLAALWDAGYSPETMQGLPELLLTASAGQGEAIKVLVEQAVNEGGGSVEPGVYTAVTCQDTLADTQNLSSSLPVFERRVRATQTMWKLCKRLGLEASRDAQAPISAHIPALLLSGRYDSVTPTDMADRVATRFTPSRHVIFEAGGHINGKSPCGIQMVVDFLNEPAGKLRRDCAARPFFR